MTMRRWGLLAGMLGTGLGYVSAGQWSALNDDGLHDVDNAAILVLQKPADALRRLPGDNAGNQVDWVRAVQDGYIRPRSTLDGQRPIEVFDLDVIMSDTGSLPGVRFPHRPHTLWLDCANCHDAIFKAEAGANAVTMSKILEGEYCGICHGAVAFPLTECNRCHSLDMPVHRKGAQ